MIPMSDVCIKSIRSTEVKIVCKCSTVEPTTYSYTHKKQLWKSSLEVKETYVKSLEVLESQVRTSSIKWVMVTRCRHAQLPACRVVLSTCVRYHPPPNKSRAREVSPQANVGLYIRDQWGDFQ